MATLSGTAGADTLVGGVDDDQITGLGGNDQLSGGDGNDSFLYSGYGGANNWDSTSGYDKVDGGAGNDEIRATANGTVIGLTSISSIETISSGGYSDVTVRGSANGETLDFSGVTFSGIKWVMMGAGDDTVIGAAGGDTVYGDEGNDSIASGTGDDIIRMYTATSGYDDIDGGDGTDRIEATGTGAVIGLHSVKNVEIITTSLGGVTIAGSALADNLDFSGTTITNIVGDIRTGAGDDTIIGTANADLFDAGSGNDSIDGGGGIDRLSYASATAGVKVDLGLTSAQNTGGGGTDTIVNVENLFGSLYNDTLTGSAANNSFQYSGYGGANNWESASGYDRVDGGDGTDEIRATANGTVIGLTSISNIESISGGGYSDVTVRGSANGETLDFSGVTFSGIKWVMMGAGDDTVIGAAGGDTVYGDEGNDSIASGTGDDIIRMYTATSGYDDIDGGDGTDRIEATGTGAVIGLHSIKNVEVITTSLGGVTIAGSALADHLDFSGTTITNIVGDIRTGAGDDTIIGTANADFFDAGSGNDSIDGGGGIDRLSYATATSAVNVDLGISGPQDTGGGGIDTITSVLNLVGSAYNDTLSASGDGPNVFFYSGYGGVNNWDSTSGYDKVDGGYGNDEIRAMANNTVIGLTSISNIESISGGGFSDVTIRGSANGETLDFSGVTLSGIKWVMMGAGDDTVIGSTGGDTVYGDEGNDSISGGDGNDVIRMYTTTSGYDDIDGGAGTDRIEATGTGAIIGLHSIKNVEVITTSLSGVTLTGSALGDSLDFSGTTITNIVGGIQAGGGNDTVIGTANADLIVGGSGDDSIDGGGGVDTASYAPSTSAVTIDLGLTSAQNTGGGGVDTLVNVENLVGSAYNDTLTGSSANNGFLYSGYGGVNNWDSTSGYDKIDGGDGNDEIRATAANTVIGLTSISNIETISSGGFSDVTIRGSANGETLDFSGVTLSGIKWVMMGAGDDTVIGAAGGDTVYGDEGNDSIASGTGNDIIRMYTATSGYDDIDGGDGTDRIEATGSGAIIGLHSIKNVEVITTSLGGVTLTGSALGDSLDFSGTTITNIVGGIQAGGGNDTVIGTANADLIVGGSGADLLTGGAGADTFDYNSLTDSPTGSGRDVITDFAAADKLDLSTIDANAGTAGDQAFAFIGSAAFSGVAGQLRYDVSDPAKGVVMGDVNGDGVADFEIELTGQPTLVAGNFVL